MNPFKFKLPDCDYDVIRPRIFWCIVLSIVWMLPVIHVANLAYAAIFENLAEQSADFPSIRAGLFWLIIVFLGSLVLHVVFYIAHVFALIHVPIQNIIVKANQHLQNKRAQREFEGKMQDMERDNQKQDALSKAAQSKKELIIRLGSVDQYIRVLSIETDVSKRTVALQAAHSEMTTLAAKLASGQISREAVDASEVREHASETSSDLARLGLTEDRLNRDIIRMFKLSQNGAG